MGRSGIRLVADYCVYWPVKIDGVYDEDIRDLLSPPLIAEPETAAEWWQEVFAVTITDPPIERDPADVERWNAWKLELLDRLSRELGDEYVIDPSQPSL